MAVVGYEDRRSGQEICLGCAVEAAVYRPVRSEDLLPEVYLYQCSTDGCDKYLVEPTEAARAALKEV